VIHREENREHRPGGAVQRDDNHGYYESVIRREENCEHRPGDAVQRDGNHGYYEPVIQSATQRRGV